MIKNIQAILLAAGKSTRFKSSGSKLVQKICGLELICYPLNVLKALNIQSTVVVGHQKDVILEVISRNQYKIISVEQKEQLGTGHAVSIALDKALDKLSADNILIMNADLPLITTNLISELMEKHLKNNATLSLVAAEVPETEKHSYGRIVTKIVKKKKTVSIIEAADYKNSDKSDDKNYPINAGIYLIKKDFLLKMVPQLKAKNSKKEFYITDLVNLASNEDQKIVIVDAPYEQVRGVNTMAELLVAEQIKKTDIICSLMNNGVRIMSPNTVNIDSSVVIGKDTVIQAGVHLRGNTVIGSSCYIDANCILDNAKLSDSVTLYPFSVVQNSVINSHALIGPFAHIKNQSEVCEKSVVGNFVELTKTKMDINSKAKHLSYLGNAQIGSNVNIGAGTITCNYDGVNKNNTIICDNAFVGSHSTIIAPVTIGENCYIAAGCVVTDDVPENSMAIARVPQLNKKEYAAKLKTTLESKNEEASVCLLDNNFEEKEQV